MYCSFKIAYFKLFYIWHHVPILFSPPSIVTCIITTATPNLVYLQPSGSVSLSKKMSLFLLSCPPPFHFLPPYPAPYDNITDNTSGSMAFREASASSTSCSNLVPTAVRNFTSFLCIGDFFLNFFLLFLVMHIPTHM